MGLYINDIKIKLKYKNRYYNLPYATGDTVPTFSWEIPYGIKQTYYIFEMRTTTPKILSDGRVDCAYYSTKKQRSSVPEHKLSLELSPETWSGNVEVRLRLFDSDENEYSTHQRTTEIYSFEQGRNSQRKWGIAKKEYYFCFDTSINTLINFYGFSYAFQSSYDLNNNNQNLIYTLQVSNSPLFNDVKDDTIDFVEKNDITFVGNSVLITGAFQQVGENKEVTLSSLRPNTMYFFRVRSYDGYDYSDWSVVNAFGNISSAVPICYIKSVDPVMSGEERNNGEVKVTIHVEDEDSELVNAYFCYSMPTTESESIKLGVEINSSTNFLDYDEEMKKTNANKMIRARFKESTVCIPTNKDITLTWITGQQIIGVKKENVYLYMIAEDEYSPSTPINYGPITIDNEKIGEGAATSAAESFNIISNLQFHLRYLQLPDTILKTRHNLNMSDLFIDDQNSKISVRESCVDWLDYWKKKEIGDSSFALTIKNNKFYSVCPDCDYTYHLIQETYTERIVAENSVTEVQKTGYSLISTAYSEMELLTETVDKNTIQFRCKKCGKVYSMDWRYKPDMHFCIANDIKKPNYSYYHGYNSNSQYDWQMINDLMLTRKSEYDAVKTEYEKNHAGEDYPYTFHESGIKETVKSGNSNRIEEWGYVGKSPLLTMKKRPEIDSYSHIIPPNPKQSHHAVYVDGPALHMSVDSDYMFDYKERYDENNNRLPDDSAMKELSEQKPWNMMPSLNKLYTEGLPDKRMQGMNLYCEDNESVQYIGNNPRYFFYRAVVTGNSNFPFYIRRGINDRYLIQVNEEVFRGSILDDGVNTKFVEYVYTNNKENQYMSIWKSFFLKIFGDFLNFETVYNADDNLLKASIKFYGKNDRSIKRIKLLPVWDENGNDITCYQSLGLGYFEIYQKWHDISPSVNISHGKIVEGNKEGKYYYYSTENSGDGNKEYEIEESEIDNRISDMGYSIKAGDWVDRGGVLGQSSTQTEDTVITAKKISFSSSSNISWKNNKITITHNMNCYPFVILYDDQNRQVFTDTKFVDKNSILMEIPMPSNDGWYVVLTYGVPYGKTQYVTDNFSSKIINFNNLNSDNVTWNNGKATIYHGLNCYPAIMLYDGNSIQSFFDAKVIDKNHISIDFKNLANVYGDWRVIINKTYDYTNGRDTEQYKRIVFTTDDSTYIKWQDDVATFTHGLNCYPVISIYDENMELTMFETTIVDANHISVNFGDKSMIKGSWTFFAMRTLGFNETSQETVYYASGEPLFTCYLDEVDKNGNHFPYTEEDYYLTKKIYVRTKHYEICNPFEHPVYGYRNWIVEPIPGKPNRYRKKKVLNFRGLAAEKKMIAVRNEEGKIVYEFGYFNPTTNTCVSHEKEDDTFTEKGEQIYAAFDGMDWQIDISTKVCMVYDYVEYQQAIVKNPLDVEQYHPFNHKSPIHICGDIEKHKFDKKYGIYLLGEYQQRKIDTFGNQIIYDGDKLVLRYPNGEFVYSDEGFQMYRKNGKTFYYNIDGMEQIDTSGDFDNFSIVADELKIYDNSGIKLEYDRNGNQILKIKTREDIYYDDYGHAVYNHKLDDKYVYDSEGHRILRDSNGEFYQDGALKVYVSGYENISVPIISYNFDGYSFNTEEKDSITLKCTKIDKDGNPIYKYNNDEIEVDSQGNRVQEYINHEQIDRYNQVWKNVIPGEKDPVYRFAGLFIDSIVPKFGMRYAIYKKYGYQPEKCLVPYFKKDNTGIYDNKYIPVNSAYVHDIYIDPHGDLRIGNSFTLAINMISDKTLENVGDYLYDNYYFHELRGLFYKAEMIDYRLKGKNQLEIKDYFSGLPQDEHEAYKIRPDIVYREDRPWRIKGEVDRKVPYIKWAFLFLQSSWNSYNRIHWNFTQSDSDYVVLSAVEVINGVERNSFSVKTKRSIWNGDRWCIPYSKIEQNSDMIDTLNNPNFIDGHYYRFYISTVNKNSGTESAAPASSIIFTTSREAISPASITEMGYDPWTKILSVKFRLDDAMGRKYDVTKVQYSTSDPIAGVDNMDGNWTDIPIEFVSGSLIDLGSNIYGDNVPSNNYITYHTIYIDLSMSGSITSSSFRIRLTTELAANRKGLTIPDFHAKMWPNEFLKPIEKTIYSLGGSWNYWGVKNTINDSDEVVSERVYLDNPVWVDGKIQETQKKMNEIDEKFDDWYCTVAKFRYPDMDAFEHYLHCSKDTYNNNQYEIFYYTYFFNEFLTLNGMTEQYQEYRNNVPQSYTIIKTNKTFLDENYQSGIYKAFYLENREKYLKNKIDSLRGTDFISGFIAWYEENKSYSYEYARKLYMDGWEFDENGDFIKNDEKSLWDKFNSYWEEESSNSAYDDEYEDGEESSSSAYDDEGESSSVYYEMTEDEKIIQFLKTENKELEFENYYINLYMYPDTRFEERKDIVANLYDEFEEWIESPKDENGNDIVFDFWGDLSDDSGEDKYISDKYIYFLRWAYANNMIEDISVQNSGKGTARIAFMQLKEYGISYGQNYQAYTASLSDYYEKLENARNKKNAYETDFRRNMIKQGFFTNGFLNNKPYKSDGKVNIAFRFRVETQPYEGTINDYISDELGMGLGEYINEALTENEDLNITDLNINYGGYEDRWNVYYHVQMDFLDTFDSQPDKKPLRDLIFIGGTDDDNRIKAAIMDADDSIRTTPVTSNIKTNEDEEKEEKTIDRQFEAKWALRKVDLPGEYETDTIPDFFQDTFEQLYFWRVAPYNLTNRPVFEMQAGEFTKPTPVMITETENYFYPNTYYQNPTVLNNGIQVKNYNYISEIQNINTRFYKMESYFDNTFANADIQESYLIDSKKMSITNSVDSRINYNKVTYFIYIATLAITNKWTKDVDCTIFREYPEVIQSQITVPDIQPYNSLWIKKIDDEENNVPVLLNRGEVEFVTDRPRKMENTESAGDGEFETNSGMTFIKDNIENFDTKWIPWNVERKKPNVIKYKDQYLLFSHKYDATNMINGTVYAENYITISRGFSPNVFGEESTAFPKYTCIKPKEVIQNALSFENPCVTYYNSTYYMYFNVLFHDENNGFYTEIYRAESKDADNWENFSRVNIKYEENDILNIGDPNVTIIRGIEYSSSSSGGENEIVETYYPTFHLFASAKLNGNFNNSIHYWMSNDGINFNYKELVCSDMYGCYSPSAVIVNDTFKVYFSMTDSTRKYGIILSSTLNNDRWSYPIVEKADRHVTMVDFDGIRAWQEEGSYLNPCVLYDNHFGCQVLRMYYNTYDNPYVYSGIASAEGSPNDLILNENTVEMTIHTEFLEKYKWEKKDLREFVIGNNYLTDKNTNQNISIAPISWWNGEEWENVDVDFTDGDMRLPVGKLRFQWFSKITNIYAVKIITCPVNNYIRCMAQAPWIDFYNVGDTEAIIYPERLDDSNYTLNENSITDFMIEENLFDGYNEWYNSLTDEEKQLYKTDNDIFVAFLCHIKRFDDYLWKSRKGPGVFRYCEVVKQYNWDGDGTK